MNKPDLGGGLGGRMPSMQNSMPKMDLQAPKLQGNVPGTALMDESLDYEPPEIEMGNRNVKAGNLNLNKPRVPDLKSSIGGSIENEKQGLMQGIQIDSPKSRGSIKDFAVDMGGPPKPSKLDSLKSMARGVKDII